MTAEPNAYSGTWHATFGVAVPEEVTRREVAFLQRVLPLPRYRDVLDLCCGSGRHAAALAADGYRVTGVERDTAAAEAARDRGVDVLELDVRELSTIDREFGAVLLLWSSFGWFGDDGDSRVLADAAAKLRAGGRFVLDVFTPQFHRHREGRRELRPGVVESKWIAGSTMHVELAYPDGARDEFVFRLYEVGELARMAGARGLELALACTRFDETAPPSADEPRTQLVFERRGRG